MIYESGLNQSTCQISVYLKYAPNGYKFFLLSYVDYCVYWYISEELWKWFVDTLGKILLVNFILYSHWFMFIRILQLKEHYISLDQAIYDTSGVAKYLYTAKIKLIIKIS